ncbi:DNA mismatch endonuclease (patch repair protein) [Neorhizobium huautlense]|uniref:Very short patch repair endonuclease n=1 Tax=Neorhizobium huautlense TaxID=67774 RepID=A0ABT9PUA0_9HYPH|nr:very short patch repair endonuclease [Neorhizobium huautlense]MDP9837693.1 DNA mismatch endonuclease (patch repair protein) [Neorhizobium huautlense]
MTETTEQRSLNMKRIRSKDTGPELAVRRLVHAMGYRFRLHRKDLPGKPDLTFGPRRKIIEVRGCYWHAHLRYDSSCREARSEAKSNRAYWGPKMDRNVERDENNVALLEAAGWQVLVIWECELRNMDFVHARISSFLGER